jgi:hypothetical protein
MINPENAITVIIVTLISLPIGSIFGLIGFELKVAMFGKLHDRYVLEEIRLDHKILKWIIIFVIEIGLMLVMIIAGAIYIQTDIMSFLLYFGIGEIILLIILILIFQKIFPKPQHDSRNSNEIVLKKARISSAKVE